MKRWTGAVVALALVVAALWLYVETGAGDCLDCPGTTGQRIARWTLPLSALVWIGLLAVCLARAKSWTERVLAGALLAFAVLSSYAFWYLLTSN